LFLLGDTKQLHWLCRYRLFQLHYINFIVLSLCPVLDVRSHWGERTLKTCPLHSCWLVFSSVTVEGSAKIWHSYVTFKLNRKRVFVTEMISNGVFTQFYPLGRNKIRDQKPLFCNRYIEYFMCDAVEKLKIFLLKCDSTFLFCQCDNSFLGAALARYPCTILQRETRLQRRSLSDS